MNKKFEVGQVVEVVDNVSSHGFPIGSKITILEKGSRSYWAEKNDERWWVNDNDIKATKPPIFTPDLKVGDKVKVIKNYYSHGFKIGDIVTISEVRDYCYRITDMENTWSMGSQEVELYVEPKPKLKFKVGDIVTITGMSKGNWHGFRIGEICTITGINSDGKYDVKSKERTLSQNMVTKDMELFKEVVTPISVPKFKVGDKVVPISKSVKRYTGLHTCNKWRNAQEDGQGFLYVVGYEELRGERTIICNNIFNAYNKGSYYLESDLILYVEPKVEIKPKFKVGDKVVITARTTYGHRMNVGEIGTVISAYVTGGINNPDYNVVSDIREEYQQIIGEKDLELAIEPKLKDTVKFDSHHELMDFIFVGGVTIAIPKGCKVGIAYRDPSDEYSEMKGKSVAYDRLVKGDFLK